MSHDAFHSLPFPDEQPPRHESFRRIWADDGWNFDDLSDDLPDDDGELPEIDWDLDISQTLHTHPHDSYRLSPSPIRPRPDRQYPSFGSSVTEARDTRDRSLLAGRSRMGMPISTLYHSCQNCAHTTERPGAQHPWQTDFTEESRARPIGSESHSRSIQQNHLHGSPSASSHESSRPVIDIRSSTSAMPARATRQRSGDGYVDLTTSPTSPPPDSRQQTQPRSLKRNAEEAFPAPSSSRTTMRPREEPTSPIEELDLTEENPSAEEELLGNQQAAAIAAQQEESSGTAKIGKRQCIICMENYTNLTVTHCGHVYCHECLSQALMAGEKNGERKVGTCPVCRKPVRRAKDGKGSQMILVNFLTKKAFATKGRPKVEVAGIV